MPPRTPPLASPLPYPSTAYALSASKGFGYLLPKTAQFHLRSVLRARGLGTALDNAPHSPAPALETLVHGAPSEQGRFGLLSQTPSPLSSASSSPALSDATPLGDDSAVSSVATHEVDLGLEAELPVSTVHKGEMRDSTLLLESPPFQLRDSKAFEGVGHASPTASVADHAKDSEEGNTSDAGYTLLLRDQSWEEGLQAVEDFEWTGKRSRWLAGRGRVSVHFDDDETAKSAGLFRGSPWADAESDGESDKIAELGSMPLEERRGACCELYTVYINRPKEV
ncbi:hypothetical protein SVAN01_06278 [Stagonosporopsis vannaccii]|nr:hypothetical protein SVAN01_06278 [Stagonosporopsis vannaccii]